MFIHIMGSAVVNDFLVLLNCLLSYLHKITKSSKKNIWLKTLNQSEAWAGKAPSAQELFLTFASICQKYSGSLIRGNAWIQRSNVSKTETGRSRSDVTRAKLQRMKRKTGEIFSERRFMSVKPFWVKDVEVLSQWFHWTCCSSVSPENVW